MARSDNNTSGSLNLELKEDILKTFSGWPVTFMSENLLAEAGFYYLHTGDLVRCAFCGIQIAYWEFGDKPMEEHRRWSPSCPLLRKSTANNAEDSVVYEECGLNEIRHYSSPENSKPLLKRLRVRGPVHRAYANYDIRMQTFETWPVLFKPRPK